MTHQRNWIGVKVSDREDRTGRPLHGPGCATPQHNEMKKTSSTEFLLISECVERTVQGMWGNAPRAEPVRKIKQIDGGLSVGFGPRKESVAAVLRADALQGKLPVFVRAWLTADAETRSRVEPQRVPPEILKRVLPVRGGLPDHPTHIYRQALDGQSDDSLVSLLQHGELAVRRSDFIEWYEQKRSRGNWPSQNNKAARPRPRGRPTKDNESLLNAILALGQSGTWRASDGIAQLRRLLTERGYRSPGRDTVAKMVDRLFRLTGKPALRRQVRTRSEPKMSRLAKKSKS
jgi:hypothetical protein